MDAEYAIGRTCASNLHKNILRAIIAQPTQRGVDMTYKQALKHYKTVNFMAKQLGITHQAVYAWKGVIPSTSQRLIEEQTGGKLKADKRGASRRCGLCGGR